MKKLFLLPAFLSLLLVSCGPSSKMKSMVDLPPVPDEIPVAILNIQTPAPEEAMYVGQLMIGDTGFSTACNFSQVIKAAESAARQMGGNLIKITRHKKPDLLSTCHRITANVYLVSEARLTLPEPFFTIDENLLKEGCAIIYFYRASNFIGHAMSYDVCIDDDVVWNLHGKNKEWIKVKAIGTAKISAKTQSRDEIELYIEPGRRYYIRCDISEEFMVGRPELEFVDEHTGKLEFARIKNQ